MLSSNVVDSFSIPFLKIIIRAAHRIVLSELQATVIEKVTQTLISCTFYKTSHFTHLYSLFPAEPHPLPYIKAATAILYSMPYIELMLMEWISLIPHMPSIYFQPAHHTIID